MVQKKSCSNCIRGKAVRVNSDIFCREKGIVSKDYVCIKHSSAPASKAFKEMNLKCIHCENFIIKGNGPDSSSTMGLCRLFSVRQYDGENKNACSKFIKKTEAVNA